jgi:hypothetical protein
LMACIRSAPRPVMMRPNLIQIMDTGPPHPSGWRH